MAESLPSLDVDADIYNYAVKDAPRVPAMSPENQTAQGSESPENAQAQPKSLLSPLPSSLLDPEKLRVKALVTFGLVQELGFDAAQAEMALAINKGSYELEECVADLVSSLTPAELDTVEKRRAKSSVLGNDDSDERDESSPPKHPAYSFERTVGPKGALNSQLKAASKVKSALEDEQKSPNVNVSESETLGLTQKLRHVGLSLSATVRQLDEDISAGKEGKGCMDTLMHPSEAWAAGKIAQIQLEKLRGQQRKLIRSGASTSAAYDLARVDSVSRQLSDMIKEAQQARDFDEAAAAEEFAERKEAWESSEAVVDAQDVSSASVVPSSSGEDNEQVDPSVESTPPNASPLVGNTGLHEDSNDDEGGDMFGGLLDETPSEIQDAQGTTVHLRSLPAAIKGGRTPRSLLSESLRRCDVASHSRFESVQTGGRICRSRLTIRWPGPAGKKSSETYTDVFQLTGEGAGSQSAADDMLATLALNCIERDRSTFRSLPGPYRDWYDEIERCRKESRSAKDAEVLQKIDALIAPRLEEISLRRAQAKNSSVSTPSETIGVSKVAPVPLEGLDSHFATSFRPEVAEKQQQQYQQRTERASYQKMLPQRQSLPIFKYRQHILDVLENNQIFVLSGETGCGKSTQVPAYILEHCMSRGQPCKIYCTEPRRISAISLAERVSQELGEPKGALGGDDSLVGYSIRSDSHVGREARLIYATSGILLRMLEGTSVNEVTHIIIDEVHERSIESDFLLIILKTLLIHRKDLKVILMSATLDAERISAYCGGCPTISVPGRTFPVQINYLEDAVELTNYTIEDDSPYALRLRRDKFGRKQDVPGNKANLRSREDDALVSDEDNDDDDDVDDVDKQGDNAQASASLRGQRYSPKTIGTLDRMDEYVINHDLIVSLLERVCFSPDLEPFSAATLVFLPGIQDIRKLHDLLLTHNAFGSHAFVVSPLHSTLSSEEQSSVFDIPPAGVRKIVISTNIAETGVTIPDVTCVIDSGKHREMRFDEKRQTSRLVDCFVAKSNAKQRRGRAGRVQEGLCFHLFTKYRHDKHLAEHPLPEMLRLSLQDLALKLKIMKIRIGNSIGDALAQALDPPAPVNVTRAVSALIEVKALTTTEEITPLGRHLARIPLDVHMGKFLLVATLLKCLDPALTIAAALNSKSPFVAPFGREAEADAAKASFKAGHSDFLTIANAFNSWRSAVKQNHHFNFCRRSFLSHQTLQQMEELRQQYMAFLLDTGFVKVSAEEKQSILSIRYRGGRGIKLMETPAALDVNGNSIAVVHAALAAGLYPKLLSVDSRSGQLRTLGNNQPASIHPSSVNFRLRLNDSGGASNNTLPENCHHLTYFNIVQSRKLYARETAPIADLALVLFCGDVDFKFSWTSVYLDRNRVRWRISPSAKASGSGEGAGPSGSGSLLAPAARKTHPLIALQSLRLLREHISSLITMSFRSPGKAWSAEQSKALGVALRGLGAFANEADKLQKGV